MVTHLELERDRSKSKVRPRSEKKSAFVQRASHKQIQKSALSTLATDGWSIFQKCCGGEIVEYYGNTNIEINKRRRRDVKLFPG